MLHSKEKRTMAMALITEPVSMFLLGIGLVSLARFGRKLSEKHRPTKTLLSDSVKKLQLRNGFKKEIAFVRYDK